MRIEEAGLQVEEDIRAEAVNRQQSIEGIRASLMRDFPMLQNSLKTEAEEREIIDNAT